MLSLDYWAVEHRQREAWMPLALTIRRDLPSDARIVSVTSTDPTLLNLARRQGWLISKQTTNAGATAALETKLEPAIWPAASCGTRPTGRCRKAATNPAGDGGGKPPCLDGLTQPDLSDPDR